jgi:hypothetical protein
MKTAGPLYEAAILGMNALNVQRWHDNPNLKIQVRVRQAETVHEVWNAGLSALWRSGCGCPLLCPRAVHAQEGHCGRPAGRRNRYIGRTAMFRRRTIGTIATAGFGAEFANACRTRQFEYTWLRTAAGDYVDFWKVTGDVLAFAADLLKLLSNFTPRMLDAAVERHGLAALFEARLSTDRVRAFKPDGRSCDR